MTYLKFTSYENRKPIWIREDQIGAWYFDRGHWHIVPLFDEIDIPVKETGEEIFAITQGEK